MAAGAPGRQARSGEETARSARAAGYPPHRPAARRQVIPDQQPHAGEIIAPLPVLELGACGDFLRRARWNRLAAASRRFLKPQKQGRVSIYPPFGPAPTFDLHLNQSFLRSDIRSISQSFMMNWCLIAHSICTTTSTISTVTNISCTSWGAMPVNFLGSKVASPASKALPTSLVTTVIAPLTGNSTSKA